METIEAGVARGAAWASVCGLAGLVAFVPLAGAGCSSSSSGAAGDGGGDVSYYGPTPTDGSADGEGGGDDGGPDGPTCIIPAAATFGGSATSGAAGCAPQVPNGQCDSSSFRLKCFAAAGMDAVPPPDSSLSCQLLPNNNDPTISYQCCSCAAGAPAGDP